MSNLHPQQEQKSMSSQPSTILTNPTVAHGPTSPYRFNHQTHLLRVMWSLLRSRQSSSWFSTCSGFMAFLWASSLTEDPNSSLKSGRLSAALLGPRPASHQDTTPSLMARWNNGTRNQESLVMEKASESMPTTLIYFATSLTF